MNEMWVVLVVSFFVLMTLALLCAYGDQLPPERHKDSDDA